MIKRKSRDRKISEDAARIARVARSLKPGQSSVQGRLRIPSDFLPAWESQGSSDRGNDWVTGHLVNKRLKLLWCALEQFSGHAPSIIIDGKETILVVGQDSFTASSNIEVLLDAIAHYLQQKKPLEFDLERKLEELDLLE